MPKKTPAADQFRALGLTDETAWTDTMRLAVKQRWSGLPVDAKVADLRAQLAAIVPDPVPTAAALQAALEAAGEPLAEQAAAAEHKRLKRNVAVDVWRRRGKVQAAIDARDLKFAALRALRGKAAPQAGSVTGDAAPVDGMVA